MGEIQKAYIVPHPPIIISEIGKGNERDARATTDAYNVIAKQISELAPDVIIIATPHGTAYGDRIHIAPGRNLKGNFSEFGAPQIRFDLKTNTELVDKIIEISHSYGIEVDGLHSNENILDHGVLVPIYYIKKYYKNFELIRILVADISPEQLYIFGHSIQKAIAQSNKTAVFIGSGDLSHRLKKDGPYGYVKEGPIFDGLVTDAIKEANFKQLIEIDADLCNTAGECGLRSFIIMAGALNGYSVKSNILSYEKPYGVGYMIAELSINGHDLSRDLFSFYDLRIKSEIEATRKAEDPYVTLARMTVEHFIKTGKIINVPDYMPDEISYQRAGVFVSLKKHGQLRGCIGTISPVADSVAEEIIQNAISSATRDPRFNPVKDYELNDLVYSVDVLGKPEPIKDMRDLDVMRYGVIVKSGYRRGILLPDLEGVDTPEQQVMIALSKAGITESDDYLIERFEVIRHR